MPTTPAALQDPPPALRALRRPIEQFTPRHAQDERFQTSMLGLTDVVEELWNHDDPDDETLETAILWTAVYAFPALTHSGPPPEELVELAARGVLMDAETAGLLRRLADTRRILRDHRPPGFSAALCRAVLLGIYGLIELFVLIDDPRNTERCFELLDTVEAMADRFSGAV